jgi:putative zinc finger/helix-turn-helix YgiT family protein
MNEPIRPFPRKCPNCREQAVWPTNVDYTAEMGHDGSMYQVTVPGLEVLECRQCQARMLSDESSEKLNDALRLRVGLLTPREIKQKRKDLGLSQQELADYLQVAPETVSRWETGAQIQQRTMNRHLLGLFQIPELREFYRELNESHSKNGATTNSGRWSVGGGQPESK